MNQGKWTKEGYIKALKSFTVGLKGFRLETVSESVPVDNFEQMEDQTFLALTFTEGDGSKGFCSLEYLRETFPKFAEY